VSRGGDVHARDKQGLLPLHNATSKNTEAHMNICGLLLTRYEYALCRLKCCRSHALLFVLSCFNSGANPNAVNVAGRTPLHCIMENDYSQELIEVSAVRRLYVLDAF
jgi:ankyrin repeat protein